MMRRNNPYKRKDRVASELRKAISYIIEFEMGDNRLKEVTLTDVVVSDDLRHANVFFGSSLIPDEDKDNVLLLLNKAKSFIKKNLGGKVRLKYMPELHFMYDDSIDYGFKIDKLLKDIKEDE